MRKLAWIFIVGFSSVLVGACENTIGCATNRDRNRRSTGPKRLVRNGPIPLVPSRLVDRYFKRRILPSKFHSAGSFACLH